MKRKWEYHCCEEDNSGKKGKGEEYHLLYNIKTARKNIKWGKGERDGNFGRKRKTRFNKNSDEEEYQVVWELYRPYI